MLGPKFEEALSYAARMHAAQRRKLGGVPYVAHLLAVCSLVLEYGGDEEAAVAALLHDAVEDQGGARTREEIHNRFGQRVAQIVDQLSDTDQAPKPPWRPRKEAYLRHLAQADATALLICAADKLHNVRSLLDALRQNPEPVWGSFSGGRDGTLWFYASVIESLDGRVPEPLLAELKRVVDELHTF